MGEKASLILIQVVLFAIEVNEVITMSEARLSLDSRQRKVPDRIDGLGWIGLGGLCLKVVRFGLPT